MGLGAPIKVTTKQIDELEGRGLRKTTARSEEDQIEVEKDQMIRDDHYEIGLQRHDDVDL